MYALRTIDVWDTLIRRRGHPDLSKLVSARHISLVYVNQLKMDFQSPWNILRERCSIEGDFARTSDGGEYELENVLEALLTRIFKDAPDCNFAAIASMLAELEFDFEISNTYPDDEILRFCQAYPAKKTIFLSDFYMGRERLASLLYHHGLNNLVSDGISSCDIGVNKRSGRLFKYLYETYGVAPEDHVHIGDNLLADVEAPRKLGSQGVHYQPPHEHEQRQRREKRFNNRKAAIRDVSPHIRERAGTIVNGLPAESRSAFELGLTAAPLFVGFMLFVAEHCVTTSIKHLFFFTREGEFFLRVWNEMFGDQTLAGADLPAVELLEVSRLSTFCPSLRSVSPDEMMRVWNLYSTQSMRAMLKTLAIEPSSLQDLIGSYALTLDERITYPWRDPRVQGLFADNSFVNALSCECEKKREKLQSYLDLKAWSLTSNVGIVDIGWRGTIQDNLAYLSPNHTVWGFYLGLQAFLNEQPPNVKKKAFCLDENSQSEDVSLMQNVSLIEMLCNSSSGSVLGYSIRESGQVFAVRDSDADENAVYFEYVQHFQDGVAYAANLWGEFIAQEVIESAELHELAIAQWHNVSSSEHPSLTAAYRRLKHNETFGLGEFVDIGLSTTARNGRGVTLLDRLIRLFWS